MTSILHMSDLHFGPPEEWQWLDDHKSKMAGGDRRAQKDVLRETIRALSVDGTLAEVAAVVISGDLTNRASTDGFNEFLEFMESVLDHVPKEQCIVVPGNHDVPWEPGPGDPARYAEFLRATRAAGFATPLLDGEDFDPTGILIDDDARERHVISGEDYVIVPINSSHFCWGQEPLSSEAAEELLSTDVAHLAAAVAELRRHDVARISNAQIRALQELLRELYPQLLQGVDEDDRVRIAVLHHQLLPVSAREEMKTFESLTNLGAIRELFTELGIQVVLHGHKHDSSLYWDYVSSQRGLNDAPHRMLVSAAPGTFKPRLPIVRIMRIGDRPAARDLRIDEIKAPLTPIGTPTRETQRARLWRNPATDAVSDAMALSGATTADVYAQIQSVFDGRGADEPLRDLICEITEPEDTGKIPPGYSPKGIVDVQRWMDDLVDWWQLHDPQLLEQVGFNHGERIYRRWGDQVERAVETLKPSPANRGATTRAVILLLDPQTEGGGGTRQFPSFVLVQLQLVSERLHSRLECTGYFRKQEMRYWWPINVAELGRIQHEVIKQLTTKEHPVRRGALRTVTAYAAAEERLPTVLLPAVDRAVDQHPEDLWAMAYRLKHGGPLEKQELRSLWERYLSELDPEDGDATLRISYRGLQDVAQMLGWLGLAEEPIGKALMALVRFYRLLDEQGSAEATTTAVEEARGYLAGLRSALDAVLGPVET
jgi:3',5'-cyclic AMP phosphodiesterase CpdA